MFINLNYLEVLSIYDIYPKPVVGKSTTGLG